VQPNTPQVSLGLNPWTALPERWVSIWQGDRSGKRGADGRVRHPDMCPTGNSVTEAIHFLYGMREVGQTDRLCCAVCVVCAVLCVLCMLCVLCVLCCMCCAMLCCATQRHDL
jgi:hypothetical protein